MTCRVVFSMKKKKKRNLVVSSGFDLKLLIHNLISQELIKTIDLNEEISNKLSSQKLRCPPYIYSMELIGQSLFLSTETGHILRIGLKHNFEVFLTFPLLILT